MGIGMVGLGYSVCAKPHNLLHMWGNGNYNPRPGHPEDLLNFTNFKPKLIRNFKPETSPNLKSIAFGENHEAAIDEKGDIYIWKRHIVNNVKLEEIDDMHRDVKLLQSGSFTQLAFTKGILFAVNTKGEVWQWRFDKDPEPTARRIPGLSNIKKIAAGLDHFAALDNNGAVWTMGDDTFGQCGIESHFRQLTEPYLELRYPNPQKVTKLPKKAIDIACGRQHTLALLEDHTVFGWGRNHKHQLGSIDTRIGHAPAGVSYEPTKLRGIENKRVTKMASGDNFSIFVTEFDEEEEVYGCGLNSRGQLGLGYLTHISDVIKIQNLSNFVVESSPGDLKPVKITQLSCGAEHCMALYDVGAVYIWGGNEHGEQGNQLRSMQDKPRLLKRYRDRTVESIHCGRRASAVLFH